jgi:hypothetical protein
MLSFLISAQSLFAQKSFETLSEERTLLLTTYEAKPKKALLLKVDRLEDEILEGIKTNGYPIVVNTAVALEVKDKAYPLNGNIIATLEDQQTVLLLDKDAFGYYKIKIKDQIGYVYNLQTTPTLAEYPLSLIDKGLEQQKVMDNLTKAPSVFRVRYECPSVQCGANTHAGEACKVPTRNCNGRCHLH